jgi:hypothetical protein
MSYTGRISNVIGFTVQSVSPPRDGRLIGVDPPLGVVFFLTIHVYLNHSKIDQQTETSRAALTNAVMAPVKAKKKAAVNAKKKAAFKSSVKSMIYKPKPSVAAAKYRKLAKKRKATNFNTQVVRDNKFDSTQRFSNVADVRIYYTSLKQRILYHIEQWPVVVGCVAWLSERDILAALGNKRAHGVSLVVNRESYLERDKKHTGSKSHSGFNSTAWKKEMIKRYDTLKPLWPAVDKCAVRVLGVKMGRSKMPAAKMHHKFLVFCDANMTPQAVWTGSFNLTFTASKSLENAVYIADPRVAGVYFEEYMSVYKASDTL